MARTEIPTVSNEDDPESETAYLLKSETMKTRLLAAKERKEGISFEAAIEKLGL